VARVRFGCAHYVLLTGEEDETILFFDPFFRKQPFSAKGIRMIWDMPDRANRRIDFDLLNRESGYYALGPPSARECILLFNTQAERTEESLEYTI
jgi:hypothetical protein